jgi:ABC-type uncharacterized transport system substrate-binding protein
MSRPFSMRRLFVAVISLLLIAPAPSLPAESEPTIALLYPQSTPPTKLVYDDIRDAVARGLKSRGYKYVEMIVQQPSSDREALLQWAKRNHLSAAISLGRVAHDNSQSLRSEIPVIAGALTLEQSPATPGISLTAHPRFILARLKELVPQISRVLIISNPSRDTLLVKAARSAARDLALEISQLSASDIREATQHYYNVFQYSNPKTDAIWIIDDALVDANMTLPTIMENAWSNNFVVVSNVLDHVSRGALLATFLDPSGLGERLAQRAVDAAAGKQGGQMLGEDVQFAVNARVASHLGLQLTERTKTRYRLVVGER